MPSALARAANRFSSAAERTDDSEIVRFISINWTVNLIYVQILYITRKKYLYKFQFSATESGMTAEELTSYRLGKGWERPQMADWLGTTVRSYAGWERAENPVPTWVETRIRNDGLRLNPTLTLDDFQAAYEAASQEGKSLEEWISSLIREKASEYKVQRPKSESSDEEEK